MLAAVRRIPPGRVATYGDIAALAGSPRAPRAVGNIMRECRDPGTPCHRVIGAGGALGGYGGNLQLKRELLRHEGVEVGAVPHPEVRRGSRPAALTVRRLRSTETADEDRRPNRFRPSSVCGHVPFLTRTAASPSRTPPGGVRSPGNLRACAPV